MFLNIYNLKLIVSLIITATIIKIIDNIVDNDGYLDEDNNLSEIGILPYAIILTALSCLLDTSTTVSLIFSAYIVGMFQDLNRAFLLKLKGYQESIVLMIIGILFLGLNEMILSISIMLLIHFIDDILDVKEDKLQANPNYILKFGLVEVVLTSIITFLLSLWLSPVKTILSLIVFSFFQYIEHFILWGKYNDNKID